MFLFQERTGPFERNGKCVRATMLGPRWRGMPDVHKIERDPTDDAILTNNHRASILDGLGHQPGFLLDLAHGCLNWRFASLDVPLRKDEVPFVRATKHHPITPDD